MEDLAKAVSQSEMLLLSKDGTQVCRKTAILKKEDEDDCTIYVVMIHFQLKLIYRLSMVLVAFRG